MTGSAPPFDAYQVWLCGGCGNELNIASAELGVVDARCCETCGAWFTPDGTYTHTDLEQTRA